VDLAALCGLREPSEMIQITPQMRILVAVAAVDFRKGIDGWPRCAASSSSDPFSGACLFFATGGRRRLKY